MRRLYADREEKRVTRGNDSISGQDGEQEQLDGVVGRSAPRRERCRTIWLRRVTCRRNAWIKPAAAPLPV